MTTKTEDDIAKEKEAVQKMVGAKGAMEASLKRIERLEGALKHLNCILSDMQSRVGDGLYVNTHYHGKATTGEATVKIKDQIQYAREVISRVA